MPALSQPPPEHTYLADLVRGAMRLSGLSVLEMSRRAGVSPSKIRAFRDGTAPGITLVTAERLLLACLPEATRAG